MRTVYVTPGHPTRAGAGYDCSCGECLHHRTTAARLSPATAATRKHPAPPPAPAPIRLVGDGFPVYCNTCGGRDGRHSYHCHTDR